MNLNGVQHVSIQLLEGQIIPMVPHRLSFIFSKSKITEMKSFHHLLHFSKEVLKEKANIFDGAGAPDLRLSLYLLLAWILISLIMIKGIKSSGKASYFLAMFPYVILLILFIRAVTLPGAGKGILYLYQPQWDKLLDAGVSMIKLLFCERFCVISISVH